MGLRRYLLNNKKKKLKEKCRALALGRARQTARESMTSPLDHPLDHWRLTVHEVQMLRAARGPKPQIEIQAPAPLPLGLRSSG